MLFSTGILLGGFVGKLLDGTYCARSLTSLTERGFVGNFGMVQLYNVCSLRETWKYMGLVERDLSLCLHDQIMIIEREWWVICSFREDIWVMREKLLSLRFNKVNAGDIRQQKAFKEMFYFVG